MKLKTSKKEIDMNLQHAICLTLKGLQSDNTRYNYKRRLDLFETWAWATAPERNRLVDNAFGTVEDYMAFISDESPSVRAQSLAAIKRLCYTLEARGKIDSLTWLKIKAIKAPKHKPSQAGRHISDDDFAALLRACQADDNPVIAYRDTAILAILQASGMRRAECTNLNLDDYDADLRRLSLTETKNKTDRAAFLNPIAASYLDQWLSVRGVKPGPIFYKVNRKGGMIDKRLSAQAVYYILKKRCLEAALPESYTPHDFRHTFITNMLKRNVDIALVSRMAGHSSVTMTARYDTRQEDEMRQAANRYYTPEV
jgi:site-specific recombinase XerD